ncbi:hypothetical protein N0V93_001114 [Gnomoniopsis smithogilvyi]|uniref:Uncharacterized protein n=1 Tax=Gnomoniopsis smithogilvyi TaxID=1191159 RepID=A0A9W8Z130_9PEZI|nr:hypothetical protein N0V93_001114 [Gnomoniopsis smithogilvyi]
MATVISSPPGPTVISSVGPPLSAGLTFASPDPEQTSFITTLPTVATTTFGVPQPSDGATSSFSSAMPSNNSINANSGNSNSNSNNNNQSYPIGLIAGIITGFSILMLVMGVLFVVLWRHKRVIKADSDNEALHMRGPRSAVPFYYMPPAPDFQQQQQRQEQQQQQQHKAIESGASTPVRSSRFAPEPEVMTPPPPCLASDSPRRSGDLNKPWPPTPRDLQGVEHTSPWPLRDSYSIGAVHSGTTTDSAPPPIAYPGRAINHPDPLRADGLVPVPTGVRAAHFTPSNTALLQQQQQQLFFSQSPRNSLRNSTTHKDLLPTNTIPDSGLVASNHITSTADYEQTLRRNLKRFSDLTRADSTSYALSPPPRRPKTSDSEANKSTTEGKLSRTPGLRLSGVSQGTAGPKGDGAGEGDRQSVNEAETDQTLQRKTWYGGGKIHGRGDSATPRRSGTRRFSQ